jgi:hypothetical protein
MIAASIGMAKAMLRLAARHSTSAITMIRHATRRRKLDGVI